MALVKCPDCGRMISELAPVCIECGRPKGSVIQPTQTCSPTLVPSPPPTNTTSLADQGPKKYVVQGFETTEPQTVQELQRSRDDGKYNYADLVRAEGTMEWVELRQVLRNQPSAAQPQSQASQIELDPEYMYTETSSKRKAASTTQYGTKWLTFYVYVLMPWRILSGFAPPLAEVYDLRVQGQIATIQFQGIAPAFAFGIFIMVVMYGLHRRKIWGWNINWIFLGAETLVGPLSTTKDIGPYVVAVTLFALTIFFPHYIYFKKRKVLFT